jgi:hypothetical protein
MVIRGTWICQGTVMGWFTVMCCQLHGEIETNQQSCSQLRFEPSTSQTRQVLKVEWIFSILQYEILFPGAESSLTSKCTNTVHWVQCSFWNNNLTSENISSLRNGHVSLTCGKPKVRYAKITFSHNVPVYYVLIPSSRYQLTKNIYQVLIPFWDMTAHNRIAL